MIHKIDTAEAFASIVEDLVLQDCQNFFSANVRDLFRIHFSDTVVFSAGDQQGFGTFDEVMSACHEIWQGYKCTGPQHVSEVLENGNIKLTQRMSSCNGVDVHGNHVEATEYDGEFAVTHVFDIGEDGKITSWKQELDEEYMYVSRARIDNQNEDIENSLVGAAA